MKSVLISLSHDQITLKSEESGKESGNLRNAGSSSRIDLNSIRIIRERDISAIPRGRHSVHIEIPAEIHHVTGSNSSTDNGGCRVWDILLTKIRTKSEWNRRRS